MIMEGNDALSSHYIFMTSECSCLHANNCIDHSDSDVVMELGDRSVCTYMSRCK